MQGVLGSVDNCGLAREVVDWSQFKAYLLQRMTKRTAEQRMRYAKKYYQILLSNNGDNRNAQQQSLLQMQGDKRIHIMKAISSLARFTGQVSAWQEIKQRYNLKWSTGTEKLDAFQRFFNDDGKSSLNSMLKWVKNALEVLSFTFFRLIFEIWNIPHIFQCWIWRCRVICNSCFLFLL